MLAALAPDLDGLGLLWGWETYLDYHHILGHGIVFCVLSAGIFCVLSANKARMFLACMLLGHVHILEDLVGSGIGWGVCYFWPFSSKMYESPVQWPLFSWQNVACGYGLALVAVALIYIKGRTPLEWPMPELDRKITAFFLSLRRRVPVLGSRADAPPET